MKRRLVIEHKIDSALQRQNEWWPWSGQNVNLFFTSSWYLIEDREWFFALIVWDDTPRSSLVRKFSSSFLLFVPADPEFSPSHRICSIDHATEVLTIRTDGKQFSSPRSGISDEILWIKSRCIHQKPYALLYEWWSPDRRFRSGDHSIIITNTITWTSVLRVKSSRKPLSVRGQTYILVMLFNDAAHDVVQVVFTIPKISPYARSGYWYLSMEHSIRCWFD